MKSYAKINLGLNLLRKRADGYHDIATVFQQIDLYDNLYIKKNPLQIAVICSNPTIPKDDQNLAVQAFKIFQKETGISEGIDINIQKRIPAGSGLGGGSSNAAVTLIMANDLWETGLTKDQLLIMAQKIGSDVPFFILGGTVLGEGRGEILTPFQINRHYWILLIYPRIYISTQWAYQQSKIGLTNDEKMTKFRSIFSDFHYQNLRDSLKNDLEEVVFRRHPILQELKELFYTRGAFYASMSGSGSSLFGLFDTRDRAEKAKDFFTNYKDLDVYLCQPKSNRV